MKITLNGKIGKMKYFWAKKVTGFNDKQHCAKCLKGEYVKEINLQMTNTNIDLKDNEILYICGVSAPYKWENNFHLALKKGTGKVTKKLYTGIIIEIEECEEIYFDDSIAIEKYLDKGSDFTTCRNFQFGSYYYNNN